MAPAKEKLLFDALSRFQARMFMSFYDLKKEKEGKKGLLSLS